MNRKLRIAIDCRIEDLRQGMGTAMQALAQAFSDSAIESQEYTFIVHAGMEDWLAPYVHGPCKVVGIAPARSSKAKSALRWLKPLRFLWRQFASISAHIPTSDGYVESQQFDLVHYAVATPYLTSLPTIYQVHDLQYRHYPEFFTKAQLAACERYCQTFCDRATLICVHAEWTKQDLIKQYGLSPEKIVVIKWGSVSEVYRQPSVEMMQIVARKLALPQPFFFFPAATWPHKNHELIIRALHILKEKHALTPHICFTGLTAPYFDTVTQLAQDLGVSSQLYHLGFVDSDTLQTLYHTATALVYPSKFEGFGLPLLEAFQAGLPVLCSNATVLPEIAQDGALYFDPNSPEELATLMLTILQDDTKRASLIESASRVLEQYSFKKTAAEFQNLYAQALNVSPVKRKVA